MPIDVSCGSFQYLKMGEVPKFGWKEGLVFEREVDPYKITPKTSPKANK